MPNLPITAPAGYLPPFVLAFADPEDKGVLVDAAHPLPVSVSAPSAATSTPLEGTLAESELVGPFAPDPGRAVWLTLSGSWAGSVTVERSVDGGGTRQPLTAGGEPWAVFTGNACEPVAEESEAGATYYLDVTLASGSLTYRVSQ